AQTYNGVREKYGPVRFARAAQTSIVAIITRSNASWPATSAAGNDTNDPTNTISIHARYTPRPRNASGMAGIHGKSGPGGFGHSPASRRASEAGSRSSADAGSLAEPADDADLAAPADAARTEATASSPAVCDGVSLMRNGTSSIVSSS